MANVLVVDDDAESCEALSRFLSKTGHSVRCVPNGHEAMAALAASTPDFILVDVRMPVMDGFALVRVNRSYLRWSNIPIALVTAYPEDSRLVHLAELGVRRVFRKSEYMFEELSDWINRAADLAPPPSDQPPPSVRQ